MMGEDFIHFIHPDDRLMVLDRYQRRMRGEKLPKLYEVRMLTKQGQTRWLKAGGVPIKWNGRPANLLFVTDIHEQKQAEAELEQRVAARTAELEVLNQTLRDEIAQRERTERELRSHRRRLRQMASELSLLEEMERRRIAADLHDHIGQCLAFTKWKLKSALSKSDPEAGRVALEETLALIEDMARDVRSLTFEISPPILHELGLPEALEWLIEQYRNQYRLEARFSANSHCPDLGDELKMTLFRGAREILMNVVKHARIQGVRVDARREGDRFIIRVADQGPGFEYQPDRLSTSASDGFGLFSIRERLLSLDGELDVDTSPGRGTVVTLAAPLPTTDDDPHPGQS
jgi:signal transduction histidine kinase